MAMIFLLCLLIACVNAQVKIQLEQQANSAQQVRDFYTQNYDKLRVRGLMLANNFPRKSFKIIS